MSIAGCVKINVCISNEVIYCIACVISGVIHICDYMGLQRIFNCASIEISKTQIISVTFYHVHHTTHRGHVIGMMLNRSRTNSI